MVRTAAMEHDIEKLDEVVLALLRLNSFTDHGETRAWKGFDWDVLTRFHAKGFISGPKSKAKSVRLTDVGARVAEALFRKRFGNADAGSAAEPAAASAP